MKKYYLHELLPYNTEMKMHVELRSSLREYEALLAIAIQALTYFQKGEYEKFDALVGENACQIRAICIALIALKNLIEFDLVLIQLAVVKERIAFLLTENFIKNLMASGISLNELMLKENLSLLLNFEVVFSILSFILTETKVTIKKDETEFSPLIREKNDYKKLKSFGEITTSFSDKFVTKSRKMLAELSTQFIQEITKELSDNNLQRMLSDNFIQSKNSLISLPTFWTIKSFLLTLKKESIPLFIHVKFMQKLDDEIRFIDDELLFFETISSCSTEPKMGASYNQNPIMVIQGITLIDSDLSRSKKEWRDRIFKHSITDIVLAVAADHRQYIEPEQNKIIDQLKDREYEYYKALAKSEGFSLENPSTFFIQHIYLSSAAFSMTRMAPL
ncbi:MAG: hypothetical protein ACOYK9_05925 [Chlamydiia bacterium]